MDEDLKQVLERNSQDVAEIKKMVKKIKNHFIRQEIYQWLIIILIVGPFIVITFMFWPTLTSLSKDYQQILGNGIEALTGNGANNLPQ